MTATNHALTGATIAVVTYGVWGWSWPVVLLLALASHFVCDAIPHWDYAIKFPLKKFLMVLDIALAVIAVHYVLVAAPAVAGWVIVGAAGLAVLPDAMWLPHILKGRPMPMSGDKPLYYARRFHRWIQWSETKKGIYVEAAWFGLMVFVISTYAK